MSKLFYWYLKLLCESFKCVALSILEINRWKVEGPCQSERPNFTKIEESLISIESFEELIIAFGLIQRIVLPYFSYSCSYFFVSFPTCFGTCCHNLYAQFC